MTTLFCWPRRPLVWVSAAFALAILFSNGAIRAQASDAGNGTVVLNGMIQHGGTVTQGFDPASIPVTLDVLQGVSTVQELSTKPNASGDFQFEVTPQKNATYFVSAVYEGATYSGSWDSSNLNKPITLTVFEATHDPSVLKFDNYTIIVTGASPKDGFVEVEERVSVSNDSGKTLVPDLNSTSPAMLSFLRFGLPPGAYNVNVQSTLVGGQIIQVDKGFALDMPIPPTPAGQPHQFDFVYRVPYTKPTLDLSRTIGFPTAALYVVVPVNVATPSAPQLQDLGAADFNDQLLRLMQGKKLPAGQELKLSLSGLPMPTLWDRVSQFAGDWYLKVGAPVMVGLFALGLFLVALKRRSSTRAGRPVPAGLAGRREDLLERLSELDVSFQKGQVPRRRYEQEKDQIKRALTEIEVRQRLDLDKTAGGPKSQDH